MRFKNRTFSAGSCDSQRWQIINVAACCFLYYGHPKRGFGGGVWEQLRASRWPVNARGALCHRLAISVKGVTHTVMLAMRRRSVPAHAPVWRARGCGCPGTREYAGGRINERLPFHAEDIRAYRRCTWRVRRSCLIRGSGWIGSSVSSTSFPQTENSCESDARLYRVIR